MTIKERLHNLVDELSDGEADETWSYIAERRSDPVVAAFREAPVDDEPVTIDHEQALAEVQPTVTPASSGSRLLRSSAIRPGVTAKPLSVELERRATRTPSALPTVRERVFIALERLANDPRSAGLRKLAGAQNRGYASVTGV